MSISLYYYTKKNHQSGTFASLHTNASLTHMNSSVLYKEDHRYTICQNMTQRLQILYSGLYIEKPERIVLTLWQIFL